MVAEKYALDNGPEQYEEYSNSSNSASIPTSIRSNYDKKSTFRFRISRLSGQQPPL
ncbi:23726_t:CDS:2, partial [Gigaspora margarita]